MVLRSNSSAKVTVLSLVVLLLLQGCARDISSETYSADSVGEAQESHPGVIISARHVRVKGGERLQDNETGTALGAVAGGLAGVGIAGHNNGLGSVAGMAGGAVLGGLAGAFAERALTNQDGIEYTVKLDRGSLMTVVQAPKPTLEVGQRVFVVVAHKSKKYGGRSRVVPDYSIRR